MRGTLSVADCAACRLVDPLALIPAPADDRALVRTFPNRPSIGAVTWSPAPGKEGRVQFVAHLPTRYGDLGVLPGRGLWANGGWHPLVVDEAGHPVTAQWRVEVVLPAAVVGVLNGRIGTSLLRWRGYADRAALAVIPNGRVSTVEAGGGRIHFVDTGPREKRLQGRVASLANDGGWPLRSAPELTVVEDLDLLHLATAGPGMVYLSERAFRVAPGLVPFHGAAVRRVMVEASVPRGVGWERSFIGGALTRGLPPPDMRKKLGLLAWNPIVDALLYDGTLPYYDAIFDEPFDRNPGLFDTAHPRFPAPAAARQLDDLLGKGSAVALSKALLEGLSLEKACATLGVPEALVAAWGAPYPEAQNYAVTVHDGVVTVERTAEADAPAEVVIVTIDRAPAPPWLAGPGPATHTIDTRTVDASGGDTKAPKNVRVDAEGHVRQRELSDDRWPTRWTTTFSGRVANLSPTQNAFDLQLDLAFRRQNDTRNLLLLSGAHHKQDIIGGSVGYAYFFGPLLDRRGRAHRLGLAVGGALLDPDFEATDRGRIALDTTLGYAWDTRTGDIPLAGHKYSATVGLGIVPGGGDTWASATAGVIQLVPIDPRQVLALRLGGGWASGAVGHRLLPLGGGDAVHGVPVDAVLANERVVVNLQYRGALFRNASIKLPGIWLTELQISPGIEAGAAWRGALTPEADVSRFGAVSATLGLHTVTDAFGVRPVFAGMTVALPLWTYGFESRALQFYVDFAQSF
ncbi:MAG: hypothetical protein V4850_35640 [Myxococcota bacterium]